MSKQYIVEPKDLVQTPSDVLDEYCFASRCHKTTEIRIKLEDYFHDSGYQCFTVIYRLEDGTKIKRRGCDALNIKGDRQGHHVVKGKMAIYSRGPKGVLYVDPLGSAIDAIAV
jgi:hypothetical protein